jgi:shikimate kinase
MKATCRSIVLTGFMGTGKSSVGRRLALALGWSCFDTDEMITIELGIPIGHIFAGFGEDRFREAESAVLEKLNPSNPSVIVTGGGAVLRPGNIRRLRDLGTVVCLTADLATLHDRVLRSVEERPLLQGQNPGQTMERLLRERRPFYREAADLFVDTSSRTPDEVAEFIRKSLGLDP